MCCRTAVAVADQQQDSEVAALQTVITLANATLFDLVNATIAANYTAQLTRLDSTYSSTPNDVCHCNSCLLLQLPAAVLLLLETQLVMFAFLLTIVCSNSLAVQCSPANPCKICPL